MKKLHSIQKIVLILAVIIVSQYLHSENLTGIVVDQDEAPLSYVSVYLKNHPMIGTVTADDGSYSLEIDKTQYPRDIVIYSFIGYKTVEVEVSKMREGVNYKIHLIEQPIMLDAATVTKKMTRKESRKLRRTALDRFVAQLKRDFPPRVMSYPVVSTYRGKQDGRQLIYHEVIGTITEYDKKDKHNNDLVELSVSKVKDNQAFMVQEGYDKFNQLAKDHIGKQGKKKRKKVSFGNYYSPNELDEQTKKMHRFLWGGYTGSILDLIDENKPSKWNVTMVGGQTVLTYIEKKNYVGIVKMNLELHFYVDPATYSIEKIAQSFKGELHIPFGYKLSQEELDLVNTLQLGTDTLSRYRLRHVYATVERNIFFETVGGNKVIKEKNLEVYTTAIDTKKKKLKYSAHAKVIVNGTPKRKK